MSSIRRIGVRRSYVRIVAPARRALVAPMVDASLFPGRAVAVAMFAMILLVIGCSRGLPYEGDGRFVDHGPTAALERYVLDLGPVDLSTKRGYRYLIAGLPPVEMVVGLEITAPSSDERLSDTRPIDALVEIVLVNGRDESVIHEHERLTQWTWSASASAESRAFVYRRGDAKELSRGSGVVGFERLGVRADAGWGSYFQPRRGERYLLTFSILEPASVGQRYSVRLHVKGGGWKS